MSQQPLGVLISRHHPISTYLCLQLLGAPLQLTPSTSFCTKKTLITSTRHRYALNVDQPWVQLFYCHQRTPKTSIDVLCSFLRPGIINDGFGAQLQRRNILQGHDIP
uniref:Secreted protein n=1 Tax=Steinernema glaseri TaxID=37863 RepID=A0A1I8A4E7_9BILA